MFTRTQHHSRPAPSTSRRVNALRGVYFSTRIEIGFARFGRCDNTQRMWREKKKRKYRRRVFIFTPREDRDGGPREHVIVATATNTCTVSTGVAIGARKRWLARRTDFRRKVFERKRKKPPISVWYNPTTSAWCARKSPRILATPLAHVRVPESRGRGVVLFCVEIKIRISMTESREF